MSDLVQIQLRRAPWEPTPDSELVLELDHWNRPTMGVLSQHGALQLFKCFINSDAASDIWLYAPIDETELESLEQTAAQALDELVQSILLSRPLFAAISDDQDEVTSGEALDSAAGDLNGLVRALRAALQHLSDQASEPQSVLVS